MTLKMFSPHLHGCFVWLQNKRIWWSVANENACVCPIRDDAADVMLRTRWSCILEPRNRSRAAGMHGIIGESAWLGDLEI